MAESSRTAAAGPFSLLLAASDPAPDLEVDAALLRLSAPGSFRRNTAVLSLTSFANSCAGSSPNERWTHTRSFGVAGSCASPSRAAVRGELSWIVPLMTSYRPRSRWLLIKIASRAVDFGRTRPCRRCCFARLRSLGERKSREGTGAILGEADSGRARPVCRSQRRTWKSGGSEGNEAGRAWMEQSVAGDKLTARRRATRWTHRRPTLWRETKSMKCTGS